MVTATDGWVVGYKYPNIGDGRALIERWDGTAWTAVALPHLDNDSYLYGVAALSASDVWAVGFTAKQLFTDPLILHWDGNIWTVVESPDAGDFDLLRSVWAASPDDVWAVSETSIDTLIEHWDGSSWSVVPSPQGGFLAQLDSVVGSSATDVWAAGDTAQHHYEFGALLEHWDGTKWRLIPSPHSSQNGLSSIWTNSPTDAWAVGNQETPDGLNITLAEHWDGTDWTVVHTPAPGSRYSLLTGVMGTPGDPPTDAWAVGHASVGELGFGSLVEHWDGSRWAVSPTPRIPHASLNGVWASTELGAWAVGSARGSDTLVEHYCL